MSNDIRDRTNKRIGSVKELQNGDMEIRDAVNHRLGRYDPDNDTTYDAVGRRVGTGNLLAALLIRKD